MLGRKDTAQSCRKRMRINKYVLPTLVWLVVVRLEELIKEGRVIPKWQDIRLRNWQQLSKTVIPVEGVNGSPIYNEEKVYYLLNKPRGVISSVSDEKGS